MGIRKKVQLGFLAIGIILLLSGLIAVFEMARMTDSISGLLSDNVRSIGAAKTMEQQLFRQNSMVFELTGNITTLQRDSLDKSLTLFDEQLALAAGNITIEGEQKVIDEITAAYETYKAAIGSIPNVQALTSEERATWYLNSYRTAFITLASAVSNLLEINQDALSKNAFRLENNYYRMIVPAIIAIMAGILMIIFFNYFINVFLIKPVLRIKRGINAFLSSRVPYTVTVDTKDEIGKLNDEVRTLIGQLKKKE